MSGFVAAGSGLVGSSNDLHEDGDSDNFEEFIREELPEEKAITKNPPPPSSSLFTTPPVSPLFIFPVGQLPCVFFYLSNTY